MKIRNIFLALLGFIILSTSFAQVTPLYPAEKVKVAYVPIMKFATMYVAESRGIFDKYGLDVEINRV
ncbi:MAG TPA: hypothetical protein ENK21_03490, partial [Trueperaceae bacterium]|nr:hypothetical protein [Trueperaceae bacterium]